MKHPTAAAARILCITIMAVNVAAALFIYAFWFDFLSEDFLVQISFVWIGFFCFGIGGLILAYKGIGWATGIGLVFALAAYLGLQTFYLTIWPEL